MARILIIDDNSTERLICRMIAHKVRHETHETRDISRALAFLAQDSQFDVIIVNLYLSQNDSLQALQNLTTHYPDIPVIVMGADDRSVWEMDVLNRGAFAYLQKPIHVTEFAALIGQALRLTQSSKFPLQVFLG